MSDFTNLVKTEKDTGRGAIPRIVEANNRANPYERELQRNDRQLIKNEKEDIPKQESLPNLLITDPKELNRKIRNLPSPLPCVSGMILSIGNIDIFRDFPVAFEGRDLFPPTVEFGKQTDYIFAFSGASGLIVKDKLNPGRILKIMLFEKEDYVLFEGKYEYKGSRISKVIGPEYIVPVEEMGLFSFGFRERDIAAILVMDEWDSSVEHDLLNNLSGYSGNDLKIVFNAIADYVLRCKTLSIFLPDIASPNFVVKRGLGGITDCSAIDPDSAVQMHKFDLVNYAYTQSAYDHPECRDRGGADMSDFDFKHGPFDLHAFGLLVCEAMLGSNPTEECKEASDYTLGMINEFFEKHSPKISLLADEGVKALHLQIFFQKTQSGFGNREDTYEGLFYLLLSSYPGRMENYNPGLTLFSEINPSLGNLPCLKHQYFFLIHLELDKMILDLQGKSIATSFERLKIMAGCAKTCFDDAEAFMAHTIIAFELVGGDGLYVRGGRIQTKNREFVGPFCELKSDRKCKCKAD
jgi:hypothetical protein